MDQTIVSAGWAKITEVIPVHEVHRSVVFPIFHGLAIIAVNKRRDEFVCAFQADDCRGTEFLNVSQTSIEGLIEAVPFLLPQRVMDSLR